MTVTISRLYDTYADGQRAVTALEAAGVPHADVSIVSNNSDNWYNAKKVDRDGDGLTTVPRARVRGPESAPGLVALQGSSRGLASWQFQDLVLWSRPVGSWQPLLALPLAQRREA